MTITPPPLQCPRCRVQLDQSFLNRGGFVPCTYCGVPLEIEAFPALVRPLPQSSEGDPVIVDGEASCFYHPQKKATVPCEGCGRFLCALCDCNFGGKHFCPTCLQTGKQKGKIQNLQNQRTLYGHIALALTLYPLIVLCIGVYVMWFTAPMAMYYALRYWNAPRSIVGGGRWTNVVALVVAVLEVAGYGAFVYFLVTKGMMNG